MNKTENPRKALGKGLEALLPSRATVAGPAPRPTVGRAETPAEAAGTTADADKISTNISDNVSLDLIDPNPHQPRRTFESDKLSELAQSIRANGIIQPLVVR